MAYYRAARVDEIAKWLRDNAWDEEGNGPRDPDELAAMLVEKFDLLMESKTQ